MKVSFTVVADSVYLQSEGLCNILIGKNYRVTNNKMYLLTIILTIFSPFLSYAQFDLLEGDICVAQTFTGICRFSRKCPSVYQAFLQNKNPEKICSFPNSDDIIVCCPDDRGSTTVTSGSTTERISTVSTTSTTSRVETGAVPLNSEGRKRPAAEKCEEYAKHVYQLEIPPFLSVDPQPVNISVCAITSKKLIVGGTLADPKEFPHMAAVGFDDADSPNRIKWQCGGSLVSDEFILTAAHCTYSIDWGEPKWVRLGDLNLVTDNEDAKPVNRKIVEIINYPQYRKPSEYHDIALLKMDKKVTFNAYIRPACLPLSSDIPFGKVLATGWGLKDTDDEKGSDDLLKVTLATVPTEICQKSYLRDRTTFNRGIVSKWQICAGEVDKDTCQGDSGGPLSIYNTEHYCMYNVVGITSLGKLCGYTIPGVYTKVYHYLPWLERVIWGQS